MPEVPSIDTSSYKQALPVGRSPLDTIQQLGGMEQQKIQIDQSKLKLMNDRFMIINNELSTLANDPTVTHDKILIKMNTLSKMGLVPKEMIKEFISDLPQNPKDLRAFIEQTLQRGMSVLEKQNFQYGQREQYDTGQQLVPRYESPRFGAAPPIQRQEPPTTPVVETDPNSPNYGQPKTLGPQPYPGVPRGAPLPVGRPAPVTSAPIEPLPVAPQQVVPATPLRSQRMGEAPIEMGASGPQQPPGMPTSGMPAPQQPPIGLPAAGPPQRQGGGFVTGLSPGEKETMEASGQQLVNARLAAANYQRDIFPLTQAIPALERLGTAGTGPGAEEINQIKSFILSNVPGVKPEDFKGTVEDFDIAKKYLTDFVNQTGNSGTNDKLAAAFAGNPSVGISNAAAVDVAKSALALRKMQQAAIINFERLGLPVSQFSRYMTQTMNTLDPRAFGFNLMNKEKKEKLIDDLKKNPIEAENFEKSYKLAKSLGMF